MRWCQGIFISITKLIDVTALNKDDKTINARADTVVVLDFETTGLSPDLGDRAIEIGAVLLENGKIKDSFQELMYPGIRISGFIEDYTGITNQMLKDARSCQKVMASFAKFIDKHNLVAHNASFDKRFLDAELERISVNYTGLFSCSLLMARRLYQNAPNHQLGTLIEYKSIPGEGNYHRALYDAQMTSHLWITMLEDIKDQYGLTQIPFALVQKLNKTPKKSVHQFLMNQGKKSCQKQSDLNMA